MKRIIPLLFITFSMVGVSMIFIKYGLLAAFLLAIVFNIAGIYFFDMEDRDD